jgi:hypothetical protein
MGKMSRRLGPAIPLVFLSVLPACGQRMHATGPADLANHYYQSHASSRMEGRQPALLFDRIPGQPTATAFNVRSDWPSASGRRQGHEILYYTTYMNDRQGYGWHDYHQFYRSARYYQVGWQER